MQSAVSQSPPVTEAQPSPITEHSKYDPMLIRDYFVEGETLSYKGYDLVKGERGNWTVLGWPRKEHRHENNNC